MRFRHADARLALCWGKALLLTYHSARGASVTVSFRVICKSQPFLSALSAGRQKVRARVCSCCSFAKFYVTLCNPMDCSTPGFPVLHHLPEFTQMFIESVMPSNHLILCRPLLLLPSIFPSIRVFSNESALRIRWPKYWSFSFSISLSSEYSGLISLGPVQPLFKG